MNFLSNASRRAPSLALLAAEPARALVDYLTFNLPSSPLQRGDGHPVIVYPGLGAGPWSTERLRSALSGAGYAVTDWGRGNNHGPKGTVSAWLAELSADVQALHQQYGRKVSLIGWSLGGIYAREIARVLPENVRQVITLGSPFAGSPSSTNAAWLYQLLNNGALPDPADLRRLKQPLSVPSTSIYSKSDGVVPWRACLQPRGQRSQNIAVHGVSHLGMGTNRKIVEVIADRLAQPEGEWRRFTASGSASSLLFCQPSFSKWVSRSVSSGQSSD